MKNKTSLFLILGLFTLFHIITSATLSVSDDGAYYWEWSNHLALSYYDHPPMIAYLIWLSTHIFGLNALAIRIPNIIFLLLTSFILYQICNYLYHDTKSSLCAVVVFNLFPIIFVGSIITSPDTPSLFCYTLGLFLFIRIMHENNKKLWYLLGVVVGVGLLSKYTMLFFIFSVGLFFIFNKKQRYWLWKKEPYLAFFIAFLCFTPVLIWNYNHQWASFAFQFYGRHQLHLKWMSVLGFIGLQFLLLSPVFAFGIAVAWFRGIKNKKIILLTCFSSPLFVFIILSLFIQVRIYWAVMATVPMAVIFISDKRLLGSVFRIGSVVSLVLCSVVIAQEYYPIVKIKSFSSDPTIDYYSWQPVAKAVSEFLNDPKRNRQDWFVFDNRFQSAAQIDYHLNRLHQHYPVYSLSSGITGPSFWQDTSTLHGKNGILVMNTLWEFNPADRYQCGKLLLYKTVDIVRAGMVYRKGFIYLCYNYQGLKN